MRKFLLTCMTFTAICLCSCTSTENENDAVSSSEPSTSRVELLTTRMLAMNGGKSYRDAVEDGTRLPSPNFTRKDGMKIAIADAKGAIKGAMTGGAWGAVGNGVVSSVIKATKIYATRLVTGYFVDQMHMRIPSNSNGGEIEDSVGYYHNLVEYDMYQQQPDLYTMTTMNVYTMADNILRQKSPLYARQMLSLSYMLATISDVNTLRSIDEDESMTFVEYVDALMEAYPNEEEYIDMIAQYIYDIYYANGDMDDYTNEILWIIETSDLTDIEVSILKSAVLVAYSSTLYNTNMVFTQN